MKTTTRIFLISLILITASRVSYACFCIAPDVKVSFDSAKVVFAGEVVEVLPPRSTDNEAPFRELTSAIKFKVEKTWKRSFLMDSTAPILMGRGCFGFPDIKIGDKYLVYAYQAYSGGQPTDDLVMTSCSRSSLIPKTPLDWYLSQPLIPTRPNPMEDMRLLDNIFIMWRSDRKPPELDSMRFIN